MTAPASPIALISLASASSALEYMHTVAASATPTLPSLAVHQPQLHFQCELTIHEEKL
jgi:hypothetical protein